jgi:hypothetical protein
MADTIGTLLDSPDRFELVRDQVAALLRANFDEQEALAQAAGADLLEYSAEVFAERANPWASLQRGDLTPIVNITVEGGDYDKARSSTVDSQHMTCRYNVDCIAYARSESTADGHRPGDLEASLRAQRLYRQVRQILISGQNAYLQMRGVVASRWPDSFQMLQPPAGDNRAEHVVAARMVLAVRFNETSPQVAGDPLEAIGIEIERADDGRVLVAQEYDYSSEG